MTEEQLKIAEEYYRKQHPDKDFGTLRLWEMNQVLQAALAELRDKSEENVSQVSPSAESPITVRQAAIRLEAELRQYNWFLSIGYSSNELIVYTIRDERSRKLRQLRQDGWLGFPVTSVATGEVRPAVPPPP